MKRDLLRTHLLTSSTNRGIKENEKGGGFEDVRNWQYKEMIQKYPEDRT